MIYCSYFWFFPSWRFLIKTLLKHCTQTTSSGGSPWATLIPNSMIVVWVLYCVQFVFLMNIFHFSPFLYYGFCCLGILAPFESNRFFPKGGHHQDQNPMIDPDLQCMILVWVLFCVQLFCGGMNIFQKPFFFPLLKLLSLTLFNSPSQFYEIFMVFPWYCFGIYGISMGFL